MQAVLDHSESGVDSHADESLDKGTSFPKLEPPRECFIRTKEGPGNSNIENQRLVQKLRGYMRIR